MAWDRSMGSCKLASCNFAAARATVKMVVAVRPVESASVMSQLSADGTAPGPLVATLLVPVSSVAIRVSRKKPESTRCGAHELDDDWRIPKSSWPHANLKRNEPALDQMAGDAAACTAGQLCHILCSQQSRPKLAAHQRSRSVTLAQPGA